MRMIARLTRAVTWKLVTVETGMLVSLVITRTRLMMVRWFVLWPGWRRRRRRLLIHVFILHDHFWRLGIFVLVLEDPIL